MHRRVSGYEGFKVVNLSGSPSLGAAATHSTELLSAGKTQLIWRTKLFTFSEIMSYLSGDFCWKISLYLSHLFVPVLSAIVLLSTLHRGAPSLLFCGLDETAKKKDTLIFQPWAVLSAKIVFSCTKSYEPCICNKLQNKVTTLTKLHKCRWRVYLQTASNDTIQYFS